MLTFTVRKPEDLACISEDLVSKCTDSKIFTFSGNLGAGKTTFIKYLCRYLGCTEDVTSPTFSLINQYESKAGNIYHMDLYRVKSVEEAYDFGIDEYLFSGNYCFIEWPEVIDEILDMPTYHISITTIEGNNRKIEVSKIS